MARPERALKVAQAQGVEVGSDVPYFGLSMVASAARYPGKAPRIYVPPKPWQLEAYRHYGICGEARFAATWIGNALSRVTLNIIESLKTKKVLEAGAAVETLDDLFGGPDGQIQMMQALGVHLTIAGEAFLVGRTVHPTADQIALGMTEPFDMWEVLAVTEVKANGSTWTITDREQEGKADIELGDDDVVIRVWRPDPAKRREADSPFKSLLPVLAEIEWATRHIFAQFASRLAGAGLLFVSDGVEIAAPPTTDDDGNNVEFANKATALMMALANGMMRPLNDPSSPESLVPLILTVPNDLLQSGAKVAELMHFWTELDEGAKSTRSDAIMRFADGMDIPAEKIKGMSSAPDTGGGRSAGPNHWGMWQIDEEAIKLHIEPLAELVVNFITIGYLRPLIDATDALNAVWYDSAALRLRPDRGKESIELYNLGLISGKVVVRENRFDVDVDMMEDDELKRWMLVKIVTGTASATPEQVAAAMAYLGVDIPSGAPEVDQAPETRGPRALPSTEDHPTRDLPEAAALLHTSEALVLRALERAGNRLRQRGPQGAQLTGVRAYEVHTVVKAEEPMGVLADAFTGTAEMCLAGVADSAAVLPVLEKYTAGLIGTGVTHDRARLAAALSMAGLM